MSTVTVVGSYIAALVMDVACIPLEGETVIGHNFHTTHGGKGSNMAACAARLGAPTRFFGKVGRDAFGDGFVRLLEHEKIDRSSLLFSDTKPTAVGFIIFSRKGSNIIVIDMAANGEFSPADITAHEQVITSSAVAISPLEIPLATALAAASVATAAGTKFILNPAPAVDLRHVDLSAVFALTPNELEARVCLGLRPDDPISDNEVVLELLRLGVGNVMLTRGVKGVLWGCSAGLVEVPAVPVPVVDTVGAGDAFNAGLAVGLSEEKTTLEAIALGVTAASLSTQRRETIASYAYRPEVDLLHQRTLRAAFAVEPLKLRLGKLSRFPSIL
jgi:ribokinase